MLQPQRRMPSRVDSLSMESNHYSIEGNRSIEIIRRFNWPCDSSTSYSERPTPYGICRDLNISPSSVYYSWNKIFGKNGMVNTVRINIRSSLLGFYRYIVMTSYENYNEIKKLMDLYFIESIYYGRTEVSSGIEVPDKIATIIIIAKSYEMAIEEMKIIKALIDPIYIYINNVPLDIKNAKVSDLHRKILSYISYKEPFNITAKGIADAIKINPATAKKALDYFVKNNYFYLSVFFNIRIVKFNIIALTVFCPDGNVDEKIKMINNIDFLKQRYMVYRKFYNGFSEKFFAETKSEMDNIINIASKNLDNFMILTDFNAYFNRDLKWNL